MLTTTNYWNKNIKKCQILIYVNNSNNVWHGLGNSKASNDTLIISKWFFSFTMWSNKMLILIAFFFLVDKSFSGNQKLGYNNF